jgi:putative transposase
MPNNPVEAGFVLEPYRWKHSRAIDFSSGKGILDTDFLKNYSGIMN